MENPIKVENHYHINVEDFLSKVIVEERTKLLSVLKDNNIIVEVDGELFGVAYDNFSTREDEDHVPQISLKKVQ
jgi:hypothetical protein